MAIYTKGQVLDVTIKLQMKILRAFGVDDVIYYIVWFPEADKITTETKSPLYGVFKHDDTSSAIPLEINQMAEEIIKREKLLENLGQ